ncbi:MAG TPA: ribonuclease E/G [Stellaceae bacterium]|nr:ribonuclease E/G [Stellaceae bacterium]
MTAAPLPRSHLPKTLLVELTPGEGRAALLAGTEPIEVWHHRALGDSLIGAVFLGRVVRLLPSLPGAFVEIGAGRPAFLDGITGLTEGQAVVVQGVKDAYADKAAEVTRALSFEGRLAVWTQGRPGIAVSRRMAPDERARLSTILASLVGPGEGVVLRSHAEGATADALSEEVTALRAVAVAIDEAASRAVPPARLDRPPSALERLLALAQANRPGRIILDDAAALPIARRLASSQTIEAEPPGLFARYDVEAAIDEALEPVVALPGGGSLVIEATTALIAIDVNLGAAAGGRGRAAEAVLATNLAAAVAVARALRLRNLAGSIIVDFVSMRSREHRQQVRDALAAAVADDPMAVDVLGWTRLGHVELTRRRGLPSLADMLLDDVPQGRRRSALTVALAALRALAHGSAPAGPLDLRVAPAVAAVLEGRAAPFLADAARRAGRSVTVVADASHPHESFDIAPRLSHLPRLPHL